jgi:hypothetical protein
MLKACFIQKFYQFYWLNKCEVSDAAVLVTADQLGKMASDLNERFSDLKETDLPSLDNSASASGHSCCGHGVSGRTVKSIRTLFNLKEQWHGFVTR